MLHKHKRSLNTLSLIMVLLLLINSSVVLAGCAEGDATACLNDGTATSQIIELLKIGLTLLAGSVGILAVIMVIFAGIQYSAANGDPQRTANARKRIENVFIGLIAFIFLWAFMQWLIPGGVWLP